MSEMNRRSLMAGAVAAAVVVPAAADAAVDIMVPVDPTLDPLIYDEATFERIRPVILKAIAEAYQVPVWMLTGEARP